MTTTTTTTKTDSAKVIASNVVCIDLSISMPGTRRKVSTGAVNKTDAQDDRLHVSKSVLKSEKFEAVQSVVGQARRFMISVSLPMGIYRGGLYPIVVSRLDVVPAKLDEFKAEFEKAVEAFLDEYAPKDGSESEIIRRDREALASLFESSDYPSRAEMKRKFSLSYEIFIQQTPESMKSMHPELFAAQKKQAEDRYKQAADMLIVGLRSQFRDLVAHMVDRLTPGATGEKKRFLKTNVSSLAEFLDELAKDNILGDEVIVDLSKKASSMLAGIDIENLRSDDAYHASVRQQFETLKSELDKVTEDATRAFDLEAA